MRIQDPKLDHLDPTNKNTFWPISRKVNKLLTSNKFYWLANLKAQLIYNVYEDRMKNLDPRIIWVQHKGSFGVGYIENLSDRSETKNTYYLYH